MAGGFCFLNNAAIAAERLRTRLARVAVLDIDVHHGNGTQGIFWTRPDVLTLSIHADPALFYPFFWGYAHERGEGDGRNANFNLPLPVGSGDAAWLDAIRTALQHLEGFDADAVVVGLGLDAHTSDPLQGMRVTHAGFSAAGALLGRLACPVLLCQEGGYLSADLGLTLERFLEGFRAGKAESRHSDLGMDRGTG
jgi:acetoin utilization deacetylase AcuC-like enzyme